MAKKKEVAEYPDREIIRLWETGLHRDFILPHIMKVEKCTKMAARARFEEVTFNYLMKRQGRGKYGRKEA